MLPENVKCEAVFQSIVDTWLPLIGMVAAIFAFAQTYDDLQGHGSRLEVILPCPCLFFAVSMICTS